MAMQARRVQVIIARNLTARLTRSKPSVNFSTLDMLACAAFSRHATHLGLVVRIEKGEDAHKFKGIAGRGMAHG